MFKAMSGGTITSVEVYAFDEDAVTIDFPSGVKDRLWRCGARYNYCESWEEAHDWLKKYTQSERERCEAALSEAQAEFDTAWANNYKARHLKPPGRVKPVPSCAASDFDAGLAADSDVHAIGKP